MSTPPRILICSVNWLGDALMALPALAAYRQQHPDHELTILTKPSLAPLWAMTPHPHRILTLPQSGESLRPLLRTLREHDFQTAYILPHSFRAALPPFLARIPSRIGHPGHFPRDLMLTEIRAPAHGPGREHQAYETLDLFFPGEHLKNISLPHLPPPPSAHETIRAKLAHLPQPWVTIVPAAARGTSKQWPAENYAHLAAQISQRTPCTILALGTAAEHATCQQVAAAAGPHGCNLAGTTTLPELAAILEKSAVVLCNDSGAMHLAAAVGTPLIAFYGITDPALTGPLGSAGIHILQHSTRRSRDIPRTSPAATAALRAITIPEALAALESILKLNIQ